MRFQNAVGDTLLTANVPAIATASAWVVLEIPLWGWDGDLRFVKYIDLENLEGNNDTLDLERLVLTDYANGGGPVPNGAIVASMLVPSAVTSTLDRGDLIGWDSGTMFQGFDEGTSNENLPVGYVIGGTG